MYLKENQKYIFRPFLEHSPPRLLGLMQKHYLHAVQGLLPVFRVGAKDNFLDPKIVMLCFQVLSERVERGVWSSELLLQSCLDSILTCEG